MHQLPPKLLKIIFNHLQPVDLIKLRLVNHYFRGLVNQHGINELIIGKSTDQEHQLFNQWFHIKTTLDNKNSIKISRINSSFTKLFRKQVTDDLILKELRRLKIVNYSKDNHDLINYLCKFVNLEHFEMDYSGDFEVYDNVSICHPNLKLLKICDSDVKSKFFEYDFHSYEDGVTYYDITCINLESLEICHFFSCVSVLMGEKLRNLNCINFRECNKECESYREDRDYEFGKNLDDFKNLEYLKCNDIIGLGQNVLKRFTKLRRLDIDCSDRIGRRRSINLALFQLFAQKHMLERNDFVIYFNDVKLDDIGDIEDAVNKCFDNSSFD